MSVPPALIPPRPRSRRATEFSLHAAWGEFALQRCAECGHVCYPFRDACPTCLSDALSWEAVPPFGRLLAETTIRTSPDTYFQSRMPWRSGCVRLENGPSIMAHLHGDVAVGQRVRLIARTDKAGNGVIMALPEQETPNLMDDRQLRELTCSPTSRRVLITDGTGAIGQALAKALLEAGAGGVILGVPNDRAAARIDPKLGARAEVETCPLDVTDAASVTRAVQAVGARVDILVNNAIHVRPGGPLSRNDVEDDRQEMAVNYFGLLNLIRAFAPALRARGGDAPIPACAWVNLVSVFALGNWPDYGGTSASFAAAQSALLGLRGDLAGAGLKTILGYFGPLDDEAHQQLPPPKVSPAQVAARIVTALEQGLEQVTIGPIADDIATRWRRNPELLARELARP